MKHNIILLINVFLLCLCVQPAAGSPYKCRDVMLSLQGQPGAHCVLRSSTIQAQYYESAYNRILNLDESVHHMFLMRDWLGDIQMPISLDLVYVCDNHPRDVVVLHIEQGKQRKHLMTRAPDLVYSASPANMATFTVQKGLCARKKYREPTRINVTIG